MDSEREGMLRYRPSGHAAGAGEGWFALPIYDAEGNVRWYAIGGGFLLLSLLAGWAALGLAIAGFLDADQTRGYSFCTDQVQYYFGEPGVSEWQFLGDCDPNYNNYAKVQILRIDDDIQAIVRGLPYNSTFGPLCDDDGGQACPNFDVASITRGIFAINSRCLPPPQGYVVPVDASKCNITGVFADLTDCGNGKCGIWNSTNKAGFVQQHTGWTRYGSFFPDTAVDLQLWDLDGDVLFFGGMMNTVADLDTDTDILGGTILTEWQLTFNYRTSAGRDWKPPSFCKIDTCYNTQQYTPTVFGPFIG
jgi:hypothetical protein